MRCEKGYKLNTNFECQENNWLMLVALIVGLVLFVLLTVFVVMKCCCAKKEEPKRKPSGSGAAAVGSPASRDAKDAFGPNVPQNNYPNPEGDQEARGAMRSDNLSSSSSEIDSQPQVVDGGDDDGEVGFETGRPIRDA